MIAANDDGGFDDAISDHLIEAQASLGALTIAQPADASGQALEGNAFLGHAQPAMQMLILREEFGDGFIGAVDIFGVAGEGYARACYASSYEDIERALERIGRFVQRRR